MIGAVRQQAITWVNVDLVLCRHMASLGHNELNQAKDSWLIELYLFNDNMSFKTLNCVCLTTTRPSRHWIVFV